MTVLFFLFNIKERKMEEWGEKIVRVFFLSKQSFHDDGSVHIGQRRKRRWATGDFGK